MPSSICSPHGNWCPCLSCIFINWQRPQGPQGPQGLSLLGWASLCVAACEDGEGIIARLKHEIERRVKEDVFFAE